MELLLVIVVMGLLLAVAVPKVSVLTTRSRLSQAVTIVSTDLNQAVSLAARRRIPMTLSLEGTGRYTVKDRATSPADTVRLRRNLDFASDMGVRGLTFSPSTVTIFPTGVVDQALTVTLTSNGFTRTVTLSPAGQVRVQ